MSNVIIPGHYSVVDKVYSTTEYDMFKSMRGNRDTKKNNINTILASMNLFGYLGAPIVVNDHMEVIDGQNRLQAAKIAQTPVEFIIRDGYGVKECIELNKNGVKWNTADYTVSWAAQGKSSYEWLLDLQKRYQYFTLDELSALCHTKGMSMQHTAQLRSMYRDGKFVVTDVERAKIEFILKWLVQFEESIKKIGSRKFIHYNAILFCYHIPNIDQNRLLNKVFKENYHKMTPSVNVQGYLKQIDTIYNSGLRRGSNCLINAEGVYVNAKNSTKASGK